MTIKIIEIVSILIFFLGLFMLITRKNILKSIIAISIMEMGIIIFFLSLGYDVKNDAPMLNENFSHFQDPLPQAFMITTIVIGIAVTAVSVSLLVILNKKYFSSNWDEIKKLKEDN
ncbi:MAG: cation:proton antiporter subunit C [Tissierellia bacterium]|nr:cation:proton antiporter subunit C [Tissierellia bacterium]